MAQRQFPVYPNLDQLKHQAKDLLHAAHEGDPSAVAEIAAFHPRGVSPGAAQLSDAQLVLARAYGISSWPRLVLACQMTDAIQRDDADAVRALVLAHPELLHEDARGTPGNWGPPMSYAANLGRDYIVTMLAGMNARDIQHAFGRACLQGKIETARWLLDHGATLERGIVMGPCETQNASGLQLLLEIGAEWCDRDGDCLAPVALILETYCRNPGKHACLELAVKHGIDLPDTPVMALHRGRLDLLRAHLIRDPGLLQRRFTYRDIYPSNLGCHDDETLGLHGTPLSGTTLLHMAVDFDEMDMAIWMLEQGADVNAPATLDADGFGGHTPLFNSVVCQAFRVGRRKDDAFARLLLDHGANPNARASLRKRLRFVADETLHEFRNVTPLAYGQQFHDQAWVSKPVMKLIAGRIR
ncbi:MAG: Ankyrin [Phycisphaerales bacterium]|nr:Ankyrin [Phycisphaerales bacterium]